MIGAVEQIGLLLLAFAVLFGLGRPKNVFGALAAFAIGIPLLWVLLSRVPAQWAVASPVERFLIALIGIPVAALLVVRFIFGRAVYQQVLARFIYDGLRAGMRLIGLTVTAFLVYFGSAVTKLRTLIQAGKP